jgi:NADH-quinone oxidoreductase subunit E
MDIKNKVSELIKVHGNTRTALLPLLQTLHKETHYLSKEILQEVARQLELSSADVYGTASFYSFLDLKPQGKNIIKVCRTITCDMKNKQEIIETIENKLNIKVGQTSHDNLFTLLEVNCLGHCHKGPVMLINDEVYTELTPVKALEIINSYLN